MLDACLPLAGAGAMLALITLIDLALSGTLHPIRHIRAWWAAIARLILQAGMWWG